MDDRLHSAMTTEHFVLQSANGSTFAEASARSSLYVMALSSSLVAVLPVPPLAIQRSGAGAGVVSRSAM
jgi:hypothetical protein